MPPPVCYPRAMPLRPCHLPILFSFVIVGGGAIAQSAIQFRADRSQTMTMNGNAIGEWRSDGGAWALSPAHTNDVGWRAPMLSSDRVRFGLSETNAISPLSFPATATTLVSRAFVVADCTNGTALATLLDAPVPLRMTAPQFDNAPWYLETSNALGSASVLVDGEENASLPADGDLHLLEIAFGSPAPLSEIHLGGNPATPAWNRSWQGSVAEIILLRDIADDGGLAAIRGYLALKWSLPQETETPNGIRDTLCLLGVKSDPLFSSIIIAR